jgi:alkylation response protein AidB-like acyl-CoA dehydrogenase
MDFDFSDDQSALRDAVQKWVEKGYDFERRRAIVEAGGFDRKAYGELAELGLTGLYVSEDDGGLGMGPVEGMVVMEQLGRGIVLEPLAQTLITSGVLGGYATAEIKAAWLPRMASGDALVVLAHQERKARYRLDVCSTTATQEALRHQARGASRRPGRCLCGARHGWQSDRSVHRRARRPGFEHQRLPHAGWRTRR